MPLLAQHTNQLHRRKSFEQWKTIAQRNVRKADAQQVSEGTEREWALSLLMRSPGPCQPVMRGPVPIASEGRGSRGWRGGQGARVGRGFEGLLVAGFQLDPPTPKQKSVAVVTSVDLCVLLLIICLTWECFFSDEETPKPSSKGLTRKVPAILCREPGGALEFHSPQKYTLPLRFFLLLADATEKIPRNISYNLYKNSRR